MLTGTCNKASQQLLAVYQAYFQLIETTGDTKMQTVTTKYLPATNTRGARIKVSSWLGNKTFSYDHAANCAHEAAFNEWLNYQNDSMKHLNNGEDWFKLVAKGSLPDGNGYGFIVK